MSIVFEGVEIEGLIDGEGLSSRRPARAATTVAGTLATSFADGQVIDGVMLATGDRILIKNQAVGTENGLYTVQAAGAPIREFDFDEDDNVGGSTVFIKEGTVNEDTEWLCTNDEPNDIVGTDALTFKLTSGDVTTTIAGASTDNAIVRWTGTSGLFVEQAGVEIDDSDNILNVGYVQLDDIAAPGNAANGQGRLYKKTGDDGLFWIPDAGGSEVDLTDTGFGGETNTASNIGSSGIGVYDSKSGADLRFKKLNPASNKLSIVDVGLNERINIDVVEANIDHDALANFVTNEHIDHSTVSIIAGVALSGGGDLTATRTLDLDIPELTEETTVDPSDDFVVIYDDSAGAHRKVRPKNFKGREYWDAIADPSGDGDFTTVAAAFAAGNQTVFARDGTYSETTDIVIPDGGYLIGESLDKTIIDFQSAAFQIKIDGSGGTSETAGTISVTNGSSAVVGSGTTFTNISLPCFILIEQNYYPVASITDATNLNIGPTYNGPSKSGVSYRLQQMKSHVTAGHFTVTNSTAAGMYLRAVRHCEFEDIVFRNNATGIEVIASGNTNFQTILCQNESSDGYIITDTASCVFEGCQAFNSGGHGYHVNGNSTDVEFSTTQGSHSAGDGLCIAGTATDITVNGSIFNNNSGCGIETIPGTINCTINGCAMNGNGTYGIDFDGAHNVVDACIIGNNTLSGVRAGDNGTVSNNQIFNNGTYGVELEADDRCQVVANRIYDNTSDGVYTDMNENTITGNVITGNDHGILINGANSGGHRNIVSDNVVKDNSNDGICLISGVTFNIITGNVFKGNTDGIELKTNCHNNVITDNVCEGNSAWGILIEGDRCLVNSNRVTNNTSGGVRIDPSSNNTTYYSNNTEGNTGPDFSDGGTIDSSYEAVLANRLDARSATTLTLGESIATKVEIADTGVDTEVQGTFNSVGNATLKGLLYPTADGTDGQAIVTDGAATLSFGDVQAITPNTVTTVNATPTTLASIATTSNQTYRITATVSARRTDAGTESAGYELFATYRNNTGTLTLMGRNRLIYEDTAGWNADLIVSGTNIVVRVTGQVGKTIDWKSTHRLVVV